MKTKNKILTLLLSSLTVALTLVVAPKIKNNMDVLGEETRYTMTLDASNKFTSAEQTAHAFTRQTDLGNDVAFATFSVASRGEAEYFCQLAAGVGSWLRNTDPINGITSITIIHDLKLANCKYSVSGGYIYGNYSDPVIYSPGSVKTNETIKFTFEKPINYFSIENQYADAGTYIRSLQIEFSCVEAVPEEVIRYEREITQATTLVAGPTTFPVFQAEEWTGKFFYFEYKLEGASTSSDYVTFSLLNDNSGWQNISGELDVFGNDTVNKKGVITELEDGWRGVAIPSAQFNGDGTNRSSINIFYISKLQNTTKMILDLNSIAFKDVAYQYSSATHAGTNFVKFDDPVENWKTSGHKLVVDFEPTEAERGGEKIVISMKNASGTSVATFTLRVTTHTLQQGNNGTYINGAVVQKSGNIWTATIDFAVINCLAGCDGTETVTSMSFDEIWYKFKTYSINLI